MLAAEVKAPLWGTFDSVKDRLYRQYQETTFDPRTGLDAEGVKAAVADFLVENPGLPKVLQKAHAMRIALTQGALAIDPLDWFVDKVQHNCLLRGGDFEGTDQRGGVVRALSLRWLEEAMAGPIAAESLWIHRAYRVGQAAGPKGALDRGHIAPGWDNLMAGGLSGLLEQVRRAREAVGSDATPEQLAFWEAVEIVYRAAIELGERFSRLARRMADEQPQHCERLLLIADTMCNVPANRPRTFQEALQLHWLMHELIEMEGELVRSAGQFDRTFYPFYEADIESGRLTREQAKELIKFFWYKWYSRTHGMENGKNFCFGGVYADGGEITNDLTYAALEAYEELNVPDPKLSIRFTPRTEPRLYTRVADLIRDGHNSMVLLNDDVAVEALVRRGKSVEHARCHLPIGCYEPAVEGKEAACTMNVTVNLAKGVELALNDGRDPATGLQVGPHTGDPLTFAGIDEVWGAYVAQMDAFLEGARASIEAAERSWPEINPSPFVAGTFDDCIARGKDIGQGGPLYNSVGFVGAGLANAADSLLSLKQAVFDERRFTMAEVQDALKANFIGQERMRQYLVNRVPKWGNNDPSADAMAKRVADYYCGKVHSFRNGRGGACQAALFTLTFALHGGEKTGALPDGRRAGESLAPGVGASYGRDRKSVTALFDSVAKLDAREMPNGSVLDVTLHPSAVAGPDGLEALTALIRSFVVKGGYAVQFNVFDADTLRDAQRFPERYSTLQVRVTGWSVYFTCLSKKEQDLYIGRIAHGL